MPFTRFFYTVFFLGTANVDVSGFIHDVPTTTCRRTFAKASFLFSPPPIFAGGFGSGVSKNNSKTNKNKSKDVKSKLKPKKQWDRYAELKRADKVTVGIRIKGEDKDWSQVGRIKSKENKYTEIAVFKQRAIIAEHAKRLYPLKFSNKVPIEWGYLHNRSMEWRILDTTATATDINNIEEIEKLIGFEGTPDKKSGAYCLYDGGRLKVGEETSFL